MGQIPFHAFWVARVHPTKSSRVNGEIFPFADYDRVICGGWRVFLERGGDVEGHLGTLDLELIS